MDIEDDDFDDNFFDEIVRCRMIPRRTNWRYRFISLNQREVAEAATLQSSILIHVNIVVALILTVNQLLLGLCLLRRRQQNPSSLQRITQLVLYYSNLVLVCFYQLDFLLVEEDTLVNVRQWQLPHLIVTDPKNRSIDEISDEDAHRLTRFRKDQLRLLLAHWRIPDVIVTQQRQRFTGEEILLVCLAKNATGIPWTRLIPDNFGGDVRQWSWGFRWFINHLFVTFYHKISGRSIEIWLDHIDEFKQAILDRLAQPAHPIEREFFDDIGHPERAQFIVQCPLDFWRVYGFLDDTNVRTCRPGSGPVGPDEGPGRPRHPDAYDILRAFYR
jgi:hypothetical protein